MKQLSLPQSGTVAIVDPSTGNKPTVVHATEIKSNTHAGGNFARSMVYAGPKSTIEVPGVHAPVSIQTLSPVIFVRLGGDEPELQRGRVSLLMLRVNKDSREIMQFSRNIFGGQNKRTLEEIAVEKTDVPDSNWLQVKPVSPLQPGEYAIVFMPKDKMLFADAIYDFTVGGK